MLETYVVLKHSVCEQVEATEAFPAPSPGRDDLSSGRIVLLREQYHLEVFFLHKLLWRYLSQFKGTPFIACSALSSQPSDNVQFQQCQTQAAVMPRLHIASAFVLSSLAVLTTEYVAPEA